MEGSSETGRRPKVKGCLGAWKGSADLAHVVRLRQQRALQSVEVASDPGLDWIWVPQKLECTQKTGGPSSAYRVICQEITSNIWRAHQRLEGATETGGRPETWRGSGDLAYIGRLRDHMALPQCSVATFRKFCGEA